jgi:hypothetical protein
VDYIGRKRVKMPFPAFAPDRAAVPNPSFCAGRHSATSTAIKQLLVGYSEDSMQKILIRVATAFEHGRNDDRQPLGYYGKLRDWQIAEVEEDEAAFGLSASLFTHYRQRRSWRSREQERRRRGRLQPELFAH